MNILDHEWDFLVVLDACRYDSFEEVYTEFFDNTAKLSKKISNATDTTHWAKNTFNNHYFEDIIYISGNPTVNSKSPVQGFVGGDHFYKVIDVWDGGWDYKVGTIHPKEMNKAFHKNYMKHPKKKFILHYIQPHLPYMTIGGRPGDKPSGQGCTKFARKTTLNKFTTELMRMYAKKILKLPPNANDEIFWRAGGKYLMAQIYKDEIRLALEHVKILTDHIKGKWIITSDHGERIYEFWRSTHGGKRDKSVCEIPFLEIPGGEK
jgi:hypothetical protein